MKTSLSDEQKENFQNWIQGWDNRIESLDDIQTKEILTNKCKRAWSTITKLLNESDNKAMIKARGNLYAGSNEANEKEVKAMFENQKKQWYVDLKDIQSDMTYLMIAIENVYELKNRRTLEMFKVRAENSKLRQ